MIAADSAGLRNAPARGRFITFEGGEGSGKSTQVQRLVIRLAALGVETLATREPGGSPGAEKLREIILSGAVKPLGAEAEALMFAAARADHLEKTIRPALAEGCFVICDRFADSTRAYQGASGHVAPGLIRALEQTIVGPDMPDLTIVLDIPVAEGLHRAKVRRADAASDRFESEDATFHEKVRQAFLSMAREEPARFAVIDARAGADEIEANIWKEVQARLMPAGTVRDQIEDTATHTSAGSFHVGPEAKSAARPAQTQPEVRGHLKVIEGSAQPQRRARSKADLSDTKASDSNLPERS